jgi:hypothetical protein
LLSGSCLNKENSDFVFHYHKEEQDENQLYEEFQRYNSSFEDFAKKLQH